MFQTQSTVGKATRWYRLLGLFIAFLLLGGALLSLTTAEQAHAATTTRQSPAMPAVSGSNIATIAKGQIGGTCGDYYGCPDPGEWCSDFARWVWSQAGADTSGLTGASSTFYDYGVSHGTKSNTPQVGDAIVYGYTTDPYDNDGDSHYAQHVAIVVSVNTSNHTIYSVGGNEGGGNGVVAEDGPYNWTVGGSPTGQVISGYIAPVGGGTPPCPATIQNGSTGPLVATLQEDLNDLYSSKVFGNTPYNFSPPLATDGQFGPLTENAVKDFQTKKGLSVDGIVGPHTWHALGAC